MFARIARKVLDVFATIENTTPTNRVRLACDRLEDRCTPAVYTVDTAADKGDADWGDGKAGWPADVPGGWQTSLRSAIEQGNYDANNNGIPSCTVQFDMAKVSGNPSPESTAVISLVPEFGPNPRSGALPELQANFTILGPGPQRLTVQRPASVEEQYRIFTIAENKYVSIQNLGITGGHAAGGGGVKSSGNLTVDGCWVSGNVADGGYGGGILADSQGVNLIVKNSSLWWNSAMFGGGIAAINEWSFTLQSSSVFSNSAVSSGGVGGNGGGVYIGETRYDENGKAAIFLTDSQIYGNTAADRGGGVFSLSGFTLTGGQVHANTAAGNGGGLYVDSQKSQGPHCYLTKVAITNNEAGGKGGGFYVKSGVFLVEAPTAFSGNKATGGINGGAWKAPAYASLAQMPLGSQSLEEDP